MSVPYLIALHIFVFIMIIFMFVSSGKLLSNEKSSRYVRLTFLAYGMFALDDIVLTLAEAGQAHFHYILLYCLYALYLFFPNAITWLYYKYLITIAKNVSQTLHLIMKFWITLYLTSFATSIFLTNTELYMVSDPPGLGRDPLYDAQLSITLLPAIVMFIYALFCFFNKKNYSVRELVFPVILYSGVNLTCAFLEAFLFADSCFGVLGMAVAEVYIFIHSIISTINHDDLTGLMTRRQLLKETDNYIQNHIPWGLMMIDANRFKNVNDRFGHIEGDKALRIISFVLDSLVDKINSNVYRYAGDEFVILLTGEKLHDNIILIDRINAQLKEASKKDGLSYTLSVSAGYEEFDAERHESVQDVLVAADARMYEMKRDFQLS